MHFYEAEKVLSLMINRFDILYKYHMNNLQSTIVNNNSCIKFSRSQNIFYLHKPKLNMQNPTISISSK